MQINNKKSRPHKKPTQSVIDNDFASILYESKFEKFKPAFKVLIVLLIVAGLGYGGFAFLNSWSNTRSGRSVETLQAAETETTKQEQCIANAYEQQTTPEETDPDFYKKLIARYDAHLACYDEYPDENSATSRISIESARKSAIDASGTYKDTYLTTNSYDHSPSLGTSSTPPNSQSTQPSTNSQPQTGSSGGQPSNGTSNSPSAPSEWELNKAEFDIVVACADRAYSSNPIQGASGSPSYYQQRITQLEAQLACTDGAKYSMSQQRRSSYQSQIATNKARYNDSINPNSPSYYPNSY